MTEVNLSKRMPIYGLCSMVVPQLLNLLHDYKNVCSRSCVAFCTQTLEVTLAKHFWSKPPHCGPNSRRRHPDVFMKGFLEIFVAILKKN
jgi:hypothetical protein